MTAVTTAPPSRAGKALHSAALGALGLASGAVLGAALALGVDTGSRSLWLLVAGELVLLATLALTLVRYEAAVGAGFLLLGVVLVEPAPPDAVFLVVMVVALLTGRFHLTRVPSLVVGLVVVFAAVNLLSTAGASSTDAALRFLAITLYLSVFAIWLAGYVDSRSRARGLVMAYLAGAVAVAFAASLALFIPFPGADLVLFDAQRAQGLFKDPNVYGPFLVPGALILMNELLHPRLLRLRRPVVYVLLAILAAGVLLSYSRAGWLNLVVGAIVLVGVTALRRRGGRRALRAAIAALALAAVLVTAITVTGSSSFLAERAQLQHYDAGRFGAQASGAELAERHLLGVGPGQFELVVPISAHSLYVRVLGEQGYLGLAVLLALLGSTFLLACGNAVAGRDTWGIGSAALLAAWCGLLANSAFVDTLHWRHLWLVAGLIWAGSARRFALRAARGSVP